MNKKTPKKRSISKEISIFKKKSISKRSLLVEYDF